ncbi:related to PLB1-phospholipase B (lysophospholipase) [Rhynchosporium secalis]|uniref:Lysophospholipase n=1 Tax=Rhynchosporium secalis TaxID=38038 RepID=A0A1E1MSS1_RHYSE|nr:related to PLB1-phospholipase B (lysophospholipase) [Rhynchosporium secalis]
MFALLIVVCAVFNLAAATSPYAPVPATCPSSLIRVADGLSPDESAWKTARKVLADNSLRAWLKATNPEFDTSGELPTLGMSISGGAYRALLTGAGFIQAMDSRDSAVRTSGLYQSLTYTSALSGGAWLLSSMADHDFPTISSLLANQWSSAFDHGLFAPRGGIQTVLGYRQILADINAKEKAGFTSSLTDLWARLLSYQLLDGADGGVASTLSGIQQKSNFISHNAPYPIITSLNVDLNKDACIPDADAAIWEITPFETGSWNPLVYAFMPSKYLGSTNGNCFTGFDNLGFVLGTSSHIFNGLAAVATGLGPTLDTFCSATDGTADTSSLGKVMNAVIKKFPSLTERMNKAIDAFYALYPNPFYGFPSALAVSAQKTLHMVDGGESGQLNPILPHLLPARNVGLVIINDNAGDARKIPSYPNGTAIYVSFLAAKAAGLTRMPTVPSPSGYHYTGEPIFFGCHDVNVTTLVWVPNRKDTYESGIDTFTFQTSKETTAAMIANGKAVMSKDGTSEWAQCLGCAIMDAGGQSVPSSCGACFDKYCFKG